MKQIIFLLIAFGINCSIFAQNQWEWSMLAALPIPVTNNAVCEAATANGKYVYSFGGISDSIAPTMVHQRIFKYTVANNQWSEIIATADTAGRINGFTSFVNHKIYWIGGDYVVNDSTFIPSNKVHIYNPVTDTFEIDGAPLPVPVSKQVQAVWRDSLIFVISGINGGNTLTDVQIYHPLNDSWTMGTPLPDTNLFKTFGASGFILGDTIYYFGGGIYFPDTTAVSYLRKGIINPQNPSQITWSLFSSTVGSPQYKSVCSGHSKTLFWVGGTDKVYNYYLNSVEDSLPVQPNQRLMEYQVVTKTQINTFNPLNNIMNLGGIAFLGGGNWVIAGGLDSTRHISNKVFLIHNPTLSDINQALQPPFFKVYPINDSYFIVKTDNIGKIRIFDAAGRLLHQSDKNLADLKIKKSLLSNGILIFVYYNNISLPVFTKVFNP